MEHVYIGSVGSYESTKGRKMKTLKPLAPALQGSERKLLTTGVTVLGYSLFPTSIFRTSILVCIARTYPATGIQKLTAPMKSTLLVSQTSGRSLKSAG